jgi:hypothetical protein
VEPSTTGGAGADRNGGAAAVRLVHRSGARVRLSIPGARVSVRRGTRPDESGTVSPVYGQYVPSHVVHASLTGTAPFWIVSVVELLEPREPWGAGASLQALSPVPGGPLAVVSPRGTTTDLTICRGRSPRELVTVRTEQGATLATDARMAHVRLDENGRLLRLCVADATLLHCDGPRGVTFSAEQPVRDLAAVFRDHGPPIVETSAPRRSFSIDVDGPAAGPRSQAAHRSGRQSPTARTR